MKNSVPDFELPPLPKEADIPMTLGELDGEISMSQPDSDMSTVSPAEMTDMDNSPVPPPVKENFKSARRRERMGKSSYKREPYHQIKKLDEFYGERDKYREICRKGKRQMKEFIIFFFLFSFLYFIMEPDGVALVLILFELLLSVLTMIGSEPAKHFLVIFMGLNVFISILNFTNAFSVLLTLYEEFFHKSFLPTAFDKGVFLAAAVLSAASAVFLLVSKPIKAHCRYSADIINSPHDLMEYISNLIKK